MIHMAVQYFLCLWYTNRFWITGQIDQECYGQGSRAGEGSFENPGTSSSFSLKWHKVRKTCTKWSKWSKCVELTLQSMIPFHSETQNDGWNWFLNVFVMFYIVLLPFLLWPFQGTVKVFQQHFCRCKSSWNLPMMETGEKMGFWSMFYCKSSLNPCGGWQEGVVDMDYGVLVWVAGVGMRPFTRALCEKIGKVGALTLTVWQRRMEGIEYDEIM